MNGSNGDNAHTEDFRVKGDELIAKLKDLIREGNVRRVIVKNDDGNTLVEIPLTVGVVGAVLIPVWAALGAIAALVTDCTITIERREEAE
jgi:hypothetical protein